ncbi:MAG: electron transfer flavoprotein beta subunit/FixA family protein [Deltaproteobacteria bacterium]|nr:MAG: electron transfer flavoprotein beta subunit/FixA family protein [Deltaproteobacteria bacterium]
MKIGVCAKISPHADARIKIKSDGSGVDTAGEKLVVGDYDEYAVEEAIRTKEAVGGDVTAFSVGPASDEKLIRSGALALGCDSAVLISGDDAEGAGALGTAKLLAAAIKEAGCEVVFTGKASTDGGSSQMGAMLAELLGWAHVSQVTEFALDGGNFKATRNMDAGVRQIVSGSLPAVITCEDGLNEPRYPKLPDIMKAKRKPLAKKSAGDYGVGAIAPTSNQSNYAPPPPRPPSRIIEGDAASAASELVRLLREEAKVL